MTTLSPSQEIIEALIFLEHETEFVELYRQLGASYEKIMLARKSQAGAEAHLRRVLKNYAHIVIHMKLNNKFTQAHLDLIAKFYE